MVVLCCVGNARVDIISGCVDTTRIDLVMLCGVRDGRINVVMLRCLGHTWVVIVMLC